MKKKRELSYRAFSDQTVPVLRGLVLAYAYSQGVSRKTNQLRLKERQTFAYSIKHHQPYKCKTTSQVVAYNTVEGKI